MKRYLPYVASIVGLTQPSMAQENLSAWCVNETMVAETKNGLESVTISRNGTVIVRTSPDAIYRNSATCSAGYNNDQTGPGASHACYLAKQIYRCINRAEP
jgi:hypothetical protein